MINLKFNLFDYSTIHLKESEIVVSCKFHMSYCTERKWSMVDYK